MKKAFFLLNILLLALCQIAIGQEKDYHLDKDNMSFFKEAELVVEGRFLKPLHAYAVKDADGKDHYYGICPVIAYRVFKGDAKAGDTIYVTREGTSLGEAMDSPFNHYPYKKTKYYDEGLGDSLVLEREILYEFPQIQSKSIEVFDHFRNDCIMFFKASNFPITQNEKFYSVKQYQWLYPYIHYAEGSRLYEGTKLYVYKCMFAGLNDTLFNSREDLYAFMRKAGGYNLSVIAPDTIKRNSNDSDKSKYPIIQVGPPKYSNSKNQKADCYPDKPLPPEVEKRWGSKKKINTAKNNTNLYLSFTTPQLRYNDSLNRTFVDVDLCVHTNQNNVYFDGGRIGVVYDTTAFGASVENSELFDISFCPEFMDSCYCIYSLLNSTYNTLNITSGIIPIANMQRVLLDSVPKPYLHLSFAVKLDVVQLGVIFQTITNSNNMPTYAHSANAYFWDYYDFDHVYHLPSDTITVLDNNTPVILEMDNTPKIAGIGDTLSIRGINFGDTKGELFFKAADDGGQNYLRGLDDQYHLYWSDTLIQVLVPSLVYKGYDSIIKYSGGAGSGRIQIKNINNYTNTNETIDSVFIKYSIINARGSDNVIRRVYLARKNCDYDYQFTLHREFEQDSIKISVIDTALKLWSRLTGLTLRLERNAMGDLVFEDSNNVSGKNIIFFMSNTDDGLMSTDQKFHSIQINNNFIFYRTTESNIQIKRQPLTGSWSYDLYGIVQNQISFYQAFLHEIGHILLLGHVNDMGDVMFYQGRRNGGIYIPDTSSWAVKGVLANIEASRNINWPSNSGLYPIGVKQPKITVANSQIPVLCNGASLTLQSNYPTEQHVWSTGETTPSITIQNGGQYTLSIPDGACNLSDTMQIGSSALQADLVTTNTYCPNAATGSITAQVTGNYPPFTYQWSGNGITPANTPHISNLATGIYYLTLTDSVGCQLQLEDTVTSSIRELRICFYNANLPCMIDTSGTQNLDPMTCRNIIVANVSGGIPPYLYTWYIDMVGITLPPGMGHINSLSDTFYVCNITIPSKKSLYLWVTDSCGQSVIGEIPWDTHMIRENTPDDQWDFDLYPNPATNYFEIHAEYPKSIKSLRIYDMCGKLLRTLEVDDYAARLDVSNFAEGMYFIRASSENNTKIIRLIKR